MPPVPDRHMAALGRCLSLVYFAHKWVTGIESLITPCFILVTSGLVVQNCSMTAALDPCCVSGVSATWTVRICLIYTEALAVCLQAVF